MKLSELNQMMMPYVSNGDCVQCVPFISMTSDHLKVGLLHPETQVPFPCSYQSVHVNVNGIHNNVTYTLLYYFTPTEDTGEFWFPLSEFGNIQKFTVSAKYPNSIEFPLRGRLIRTLPSQYQASAALQKTSGNFSSSFSKDHSIYYFHALVDNLPIIAAPPPPLSPSSQAVREIGHRRIAWNDSGSLSWPQFESSPPAHFRIMIEISTPLRPFPQSSPHQSFAVPIPLSVFYPSPGLCPRRVMVECIMSDSIRTIQSLHPDHHFIPQPDLSPQYRCGPGGRSTRRFTAIPANVSDWPLCASIYGPPLPPPPVADDPNSPHRMVLLRIVMGESIIPRMFEPIHYIAGVAILCIFFWWLLDLRRKGLPIIS